MVFRCRNTFFAFLLKTIFLLFAVHRLRLIAHLDNGLEFFQYGLAGGGALAAVFSLILSLLYLNRKSTIIVATVTTGLFLVGMYRFVYLKNPMSFPGEPYGESLVAWVIVFMACVLFFFLIGISTSFLQQRIIDLSSELDARNKAIEEQSKQIEYYANHDLLTGLPSLRVADKRLDSVLQSAEEKRHKSALLFLDLDGFKMINDRYGHDAGDTVLKTVSVRILSVIRSTDTACRIGGDEFLVIIERVEDSKDIASLCSRLINTISMPVSYKNIQLTVGVSIGAATYPCSAEDANSLRAKADELMYQVKHSGKNNYQIAVENTSAAIH